MKQSSPLLVVLFVFVPSGIAYPARACEKISKLTIENRSIFDEADPALNGRFAWVYRAANSLHVETRPGFIRRTLLFEEGDCYDPELLRESERLLRGFEFLASSRVVGERQPDGTVHVTVRTRDEWSTQVDIRVGYNDRLELRGARLNESNLLGSGRTLGVFYLENELARDYGLIFVDPQLGRRRWQLRTAAARTRAGAMLEQALTHPFAGETGRWAARQSVRHEDRFVEYVLPGQPERSHILVPAVERGGDFALLRRLGRPGTHQFLIGGALSYQSFKYPDEQILLVTDGKFANQEPAAPAHVEQVRSRLDEFDNARLHLVLGRRNVRWTTRQGLHTLAAAEDVRLGTEAMVSVAPPFPFFGSEDEALASLSVYGGLAAGQTLSTVRVLADGRRVFRGPESGWKDMIGQADVVVYRRSADRPLDTRVLRASAAGGWHTRTPFQLTLAREHGVRGYDLDAFPGGRRVVFSAEERRYLGKPFGDLLALGGALFVDVGRVWAGDALFGVESGWRAAVGLGLRGAFPAGSRSTYRIDAALPIERGTGWNRVRFTVTADALRAFSSIIPDKPLLHSRQVPVSGELFHFPD